MVNIDTIKDIFAHMHWADESVWRSTLSCQDCIEDSRLRESLYHIHIVQRVFLLAWRGEPFGDPIPQFGDLNSLRAWSEPYYDEVRFYLSTLNDKDLEQAMPLPWSKAVEERLGYAPGPTTMGETALQVAMHSMHHRGQVSARIRELGGEPPLVDYIAWVWQGRPSVTPVL